MDEDEFPPVPRTPNDLIARWAVRDAVYAKMRPGLSSEMVETIRAARMKEVNKLPRDLRGKMWTRVKFWRAPVHPDFGSLRDYIK